MIKQLSAHQADVITPVDQRKPFALAFSARGFGRAVALLALVVAALFINRSYISIAAAGDMLVTDVVEYQYWGNIIVEEQSARNSVFVEYSYGIDQPSKVAPGIPVFYATLHALTGWNINSYPAMMPSLLLVWSILALYVVLCRITTHRWSPFLALALFVFGQQSLKIWDVVNPSFAPSLSLYYTLSPANVVGFCLLIATFLVLTYAAEDPRDIRPYLVAAIMTIYVVIAHQLTPVILVPVLALFVLCYFRRLPWRRLFMTGAGLLLVGWFARPVYLSFETVSVLGSSKQSGASFFAATASFRQDLHLRIGLMGIIAALAGVISGLQAAIIKRTAATPAFFFSLVWLPVLAAALASTTIGINANRFENYLWISLLPAAALGIDFLLKSHTYENALGPVWTLLFLVLVFGAGASLLTVQRPDQAIQVFDKGEQAAAEWLGMQLQGVADVVATDVQSAPDSRGLRPFLVNQTLIRPSAQLLPAVPAPYNEPLKALDRILKNPQDVAAIMRGAEEYQIKYFFFTLNGNPHIQEAIAESPYFIEVYRNEAAVIYGLSPLFDAIMNGKT